MGPEFASGDQQEFRWAETAEHDRTSATDLIVLPAASISGPDKTGNRGPTAQVTSDLTVSSNPRRSFTVSAQIQNPIVWGAYDGPIQQVHNFRWLAPVDVQGNDIGTQPGKLVGPAGTFEAFRAQVPVPVHISRTGPAPLWEYTIATGVNPDGSELILNSWLTLAAVAAGDSVRVFHSGVLRQGTEKIYCLVERAMLDAGQHIGGFGMMCSQFDGALQAEQDPTFSLNFGGLEKDRDPATFGTGTVVPAPTHKPFNSGSHWRFFREGGDLLDPLPQQCNWSVQSNPRAIKPGGTPGGAPHSQKKNRFAMTGTYRMYSTPEAIAIGDKADDDIGSELAWALDDETRGYLWWYPAVDYVSGNQDGSGAESDIFTPMQWMAHKDSTTGVMGCMARFDGLPPRP